MRLFQILNWPKNNVVFSFMQRFRVSWALGLMGIGNHEAMMNILTRKMKDHNSSLLDAISELQL